VAAVKPRVPIETVRRRGEQDVDKLLELLNVQRPRIMLVDATTGEDIREALDSEIEHIRRNANFSGVAMLRLGEHTRTVTLRRIG